MALRKELVMYSRSTGCPFITLAKRVLTEYQVPYREIMIDQDSTASHRVEAWTGYRSVPTLIIAAVGEDLPITEPAPIDKHGSPRGINRGSMITEPNINELITWLQQHQLLSAADGDIDNLYTGTVG